MALASLAITALTTYSQQQAQHEAAVNQAKSIKDSRDLAHSDAERAAAAQYEQSAAEANAHASEALKDMAAFDAATSEFGGGGNTANRGLAVMGVRAGQNQATIAGNYRNTVKDLAIGDVANGLRADSQFRSIKNPSTTEGLLTIASSGVPYLSGLSKTKDKPKDPPSD